MLGGSLGGVTFRTGGFSLRGGAGISRRGEGGMVPRLGGGRGGVTLRGGGVSREFTPAWGVPAGCVTPGAVRGGRLPE